MCTISWYSIFVLILFCLCSVCLFLCELHIFVLDKFLLKGLGTILGHKMHQPPIYIKLTQFQDSDSRKLPLKYYLLRCCSFWEISKTLNWNLLTLCYKLPMIVHLCLLLKSLMSITSYLVKSTVGVSYW